MADVEAEPREPQEEDYFSPILPPELLNMESSGEGGGGKGGIRIEGLCRVRVLLVSGQTGLCCMFVWEVSCLCVLYEVLALQSRGKRREKHNKSTVVFATLSQTLTTMLITLCEEMCPLLGHCVGYKGAGPSHGLCLLSAGVFVEWWGVC